MSIPSLDDVLHDRSTSPYTKPHFAQFLSSVHCLENLEFVLEVSQYIDLVEAGNLESHPNLWVSIRRTFIVEDAAKEINLPYDIRNKLSTATHPELCCVKRARQIIYEILLDLYNEFAKRVTVTWDPKYSASLQVSSRRASEIISPESDRSALVQVIPRSGSFSYYDENPRARPQQLSPSTDSDVIIFDEEAEIGNKSRNNSTGSTSSSRGSSIGSLVDSLKNNDMMNWRKAVRKFKLRRFSNDESQHP
ncbi:hypothetical protein JA9_002850 [Meyerozyma sp. JA9]|nr:hypothetical protein JA9_002850 [Meyerozyma sp. JA9]